MPRTLTPTGTVFPWPASEKNTWTEEPTATALGLEPAETASPPRDVCVHPAAELHDQEAERVAPVGVDEEHLRDAPGDRGGGAVPRRHGVTPQGRLLPARVVLHDQ